MQKYTALCCIYLTYAKLTETLTSRTNFATVQTVQKVHFYAPQLYRQVMLRRVLAMAILSVCLSVRPSVRLSRPGAETTE